MSWYSQGTYSNAANSAVINGSSNTGWATNKIRPGDAFMIAGVPYEIKTVDSDTKLTLVSNVAAAHTNAAYSILPLTGAAASGAYMESDLVNSVAEALRKDKFFMAVFSDLLLNATAADMTVTFPDGSSVGPIPNWAKVSTAAASQDWATQAKADMLVIQNDVKDRQTDVTTKQGDVTTKATAASDSATLAQKWASNPEDTAVTTGKYSALHWAAKAAASATASEASRQAADADKAATAADRVQTGKDVTSTAASAAAAQASAQQAASYDPTKAVPRMGRPSAAGYTDINAMGNESDVGQWQLDNSANYNLPNVPEAQPGLLEVVMGGRFARSQIYTGMYGSMFIRSLNSAWNASSPDWMPWRHIGANYTRMDGLDVNTLFNSALLYGNQVVNGPANTGSQYCFIKVEAYGTSPVKQTLTWGTVNREFVRTYASGAWSDWIEYVRMDLNGITKILRGVDSTFTLGADGSNPLHAVSLRQMQTAIGNVSASGGINGVMSTFIGDVSWWTGNPANIPTGYVTPTGTLSLRSDYPEIWSLIDAGVLKSVTEADFTAYPVVRGCFTKGTVTSGANANFRWPDLNGATSGAIQGLVLRGAAIGKSYGEIYDSALPNAKGSLPQLLGTKDGATAADQGGATSPIRWGGVGTTTRMNTVAASSGLFDPSFDLSRASAIYKDGITEVRPPSVMGTWIMRAKGTFSAQTSFNVMITAASNPANSSTTEGGLVRSVLNGPSGELGAAEMLYRHLVNSSGVAAKNVVIRTAGASGEVTVDNQGWLISPRIAAPVLACAVGAYEMNFTNLASGIVQVNHTSNVNTVNWGGLNFAGVAQIDVTAGVTAQTYTADGVSVESTGNQSNNGLRVWGSSRQYDVYYGYYLLQGQYHSARFVQDGTATFTARSTGACYAASFNPTSDSNLKFDKEFIGDALTKSMQLRGMTYTINGEHKIGIIAQDAQAVMPDSVSTDDTPVVLEDGTILDSHLALDYASITALNTEAIKDVVRLMLECMTSPETATQKLRALVDVINTKNDDKNPIPEGMTMKYALVDQPGQWTPEEKANA